MWHQWFNFNVIKLWKYFLCTKKTKIMTLFNNFFSFVSEFDAFNRVPWRIRVHSSACKQRMCRITHDNAGGWIKSLFFVFCAHKKHSHSFVNIWFELQMSNFKTMDLTIFLGLGTFSVTLLSMVVRKLTDFIKKIYFVYLLTYTIT